MSSAEEAPVAPSVPTNPNTSSSPGWKRVSPSALQCTDPMTLLRNTKRMGKKSPGPVQLFIAPSVEPDHDSHGASSSSTSEPMSLRDNPPAAAGPSNVLLLPSHSYEHHCQATQSFPQNGRPQRTMKAAKKQKTLQEEWLEQEMESTSKEAHNGYLVRLTLKFIHTSLISLQAIICYLCQQAFKYQNNVDFIIHTPPSPDKIQAFADGTGEGPLTTNIKLNVMGLIMSEWNQALVKFLLSTLRSWQQQLELDLPSDEYLRYLLVQKLRNLRSTWRLQLSKVLPGGEHETVDQLSDCVANRLARINKAA